MGTDDRAISTLAIVVVMDETSRLKSYICHEASHLSTHLCNSLVRFCLFTFASHCLRSSIMISHFGPMILP